MIRRTVAAVLFLVFSNSCEIPVADSGNPHYDVEVRWTAYGIPHVKAGNWGSLGYGFAWATATDGLCVFAREVSRANGTLVKDFGRTDENYASDVFHRVLLTDDRVRAYAAAQTEDDRAFDAGFVVGYNRFLRDNAGKLPASCNHEDWVRQIESDDLSRMIIAFGIRYGLGLFTENIVDAAPPGKRRADLRPKIADEPGFGSNAIAVGGDLSATGRGILLGNPHYYWHGPSRFHMIHLTIPGIVDVMGVSLLAGNFIAIGFNEDIAWTHTVSTAKRYTLYELDLNPKNPLQYRYGKGYRDIEPRTVDIDGEPHTVYMSHYGPLVVSEKLPWTANKAYAIRDAVYGNNAAESTYHALYMARSVADVEAAIGRQGTFFVNTIAADRHGEAFYGDMSSTPDLDEATLGHCGRAMDGLPLEGIVLDGSDPACEWKADSRSANPGTMPAANMPHATARDYFENSNDSYWLANPERPLRGFSPIIGSESTPLNLRTRAGLEYLKEARSDDGKISVKELQNMIYSHRHFGAETFLDDLLKLCNNAPDTLKDSCGVLKHWDRSARTRSRGVQLWAEFWNEAQGLEDLYKIPFDAEHPVETPRGLNIDIPTVRAGLIAALEHARENLQTKGISANAPWGELQFAERNGQRIPIPGGVGWHGILSVIYPEFTEGKGYTPIVSGNSYIQVVSWDNDGTLDVRGILTYSQSPEPDSPHYSDQTKLYSEGKWIRLPFTEAEIHSDPDFSSIRLQD